MVEEEIPRRLQRFQNDESFQVYKRPKSLVEKFFEKIVGIFKGKQKPSPEQIEKEEQIKKVFEKIKTIIQKEEQNNKEVNEETVAIDVYKQLIAEKELSQHTEKPIKEDIHELKVKTSQMTLRQIREFRRKHQRLPSDTEYDSIVDNVFGQMKKEFEKSERERRKKEREEKINKRKKKEELKEETKLNKREQRHGRHKKEENKEEPEISPQELLGITSNESTDINKMEVPMPGKSELGINGDIDIPNLSDISAPKDIEDLSNPKKEKSKKRKNKY